MSLVLDNTENHKPFETVVKPFKSLHYSEDVDPVTGKRKVLVPMTKVKKSVTSTRRKGGKKTRKRKIKKTKRSKKSLTKSKKKRSKK